MSLGEDISSHVTLPFNSFFICSNSKERKCGWIQEIVILKTSVVVVITVESSYTDITGTTKVMLSYQNIAMFDQYENWRKYKEPSTNHAQ